MYQDSPVHHQPQCCVNQRLGKRSGRSKPSRTQMIRLGLYQRLPNNSEGLDEHWLKIATLLQDPLSFEIVAATAIADDRLPLSHQPMG